MEENNFKVGDRVQLSDIAKAEYIDFKENPHNGVGMITRINDNTQHNILVEWHGSISNYYRPIDLQLVKLEVKPKPERKPNPEKELVNSPDHYKSNGMEAIDVIEGFGLGFNLGNATKYILRCGKKDDAIQELKKAIWYLEREISKRSEK